MRACRDELTLAPETIRASRVQVAELDGRVVGVAEVAVRDSTASLERLFVEPDALRSGIGTVLLAWARRTAGSAGSVVLTIEADPGAAGFYHRSGAVDDGLVASGSIPGRLIPRLRLEP